MLSVGSRGPGESPGPISALSAAKLLVHLGGRGGLVGSCWMSPTRGCIVAILSWACWSAAPEPAKVSEIPAASSPTELSAGYRRHCVRVMQAPQSVTGRGGARAMTSSAVEAWCRNAAGMRIQGTITAQPGQPRFAPTEPGGRAATSGQPTGHASPLAVAFRLDNPTSHVSVSSQCAPQSDYTECMYLADSVIL